MNAFVKWVACIAACMLLASVVRADDIKRTSNPNSSLPLATAVTVPAGSELVFFSGTLADVANPDAPKGTVDAYGDTKTQALSILLKFEKLLANEGLTMSDVIKVNVFMVGDSRLDGKMDFAGLNAAYGKFFGTSAQPNKPVRTTVQVAALPMPGGLIEIELTAARAAAK